MALVLSIDYSIKHAFSILTQMVACLLPLISVGILAVERKLRVMKIKPREEKKVQKKKERDTSTCICRLEGSS